MTASPDKPLNFFWFIPTHGDGSYLGSEKQQRPPEFAYFREIAQAVDRLGFPGVLLPTGQSCEDSWITATGLAAHTERLKFLVALRPGVISPALAARQTAALDRLSNGRLLLNVVVGGNPVELAGDGVFTPHDERYAQAGEFLDIWRRLLTGETVDFDGKYYKVQGGRLDILPVQKPVPPLYFGGSSDAGHELAAEVVDKYLTWGEPVQTDRVILTLGPAEEVDLVRCIYRAFVHQGYSEREIADDLNQRGVPTDLGRPWTRGTVHQILINEKYVGDNVWNRRSFKLKKKRVANEPEMWIRAQDVFQAVVERELFEAARTIINARSFRLSDEEMLRSLHKLYQQKGLLSGIVIDECDGLPSSSAYSSRFGSLLRAYRLIGFTPDRDYRYVQVNRDLRKLHPEILRQVLDGLKATGSDAWQDLQTDRVIVNNEFSLGVVVARCVEAPTGLLRWQLRFDTSLAPDITIVVRMDSANRAPLDYYLFPRIDMFSEKLRLAEDNALGLDAYRFDDLDLLYEIAKPVPLAEAI